MTMPPKIKSTAKAERMDALEELRLSVEEIELAIRLRKAKAEMAGLVSAARAARASRPDKT